MWLWAVYFCPRICIGGDGSNAVFAVWACPCLGPLVFLPQAACEGNGVWCGGKPWPACQEAAHGMKWAQTKKRRRWRGVRQQRRRYMPSLVTPLNPFVVVWSNSEWQDTHHTSAAGHISGWLGSAQVLWVASRYRAKMECEMLHFSLHALPSCVSGRGEGRWKSHYVTRLTWPPRSQEKLICEIWFRS